MWCSGNGKNWIYYNVTDLVSAGAENTATTTKINATVGDFDGRVYGIVLVVVYEGGDNPKDIQYCYAAQSENEAGYSRGEDGYVNLCNAILTLDLEAKNGYMGKRYTGGLESTHGTHLNSTAT